MLSPPPSFRGAAALPVLALALLALVGACGPRRPALAVSAKASPPAAGSGLRAYRDPSTGAFTEPPAPTPGPAPSLAAPSLPAPALTEINAPGGGRMIHLQGTFQSDVKATVGAHGVEVSCATRGAGH